MEDAESPSAENRSRSAVGPRRVRPAREKTSRLEAAAPLFFFAAVALAIAYFNYTTGPHTGGRLPLWMLFAAVGTIVAGGGVASLVAPEGSEADSFPAPDDEQSVVVPREEWRELHDRLERYRRIVEGRGRPEPETQIARTTDSTSAGRAETERALAELERTIRDSGAIAPARRRSKSSPSKRTPRRARGAGGRHPAEVARRAPEIAPERSGGTTDGSSAADESTRGRGAPAGVDPARPLPPSARTAMPSTEAGATLSWRESVSPELAKLIAELYPETASANSLAVPEASGAARTIACAACGEPAEERGESERCDLCGEALCEVCVASALLEERPTRCRNCREPRSRNGNGADRV
jgi:hypothetical protein